MSDDIDLVYGSDRPIPYSEPVLSKRLPPFNVDLILLMADRFNRSAQALSLWSPTAKKAVDYFEGKQWSAAELAKIGREGRAALVINKIQPLVRMVLGFHLSNLTDVRFMPGHDGSGTGDIAQALTHVEKSLAQINDLPFIDAEVYLDGLLTGRGYWDDRLDFRKNDLGMVATRAEDPFSVYPDADAQSYDLNTGNYLFTSRWTSIDEIEYYFGPQASTMLSPWVGNGSFVNVPANLYDYYEELTPWRRFGGEEDTLDAFWNGYFDNFWDWVDTARKNIRMIDCQHYVRVKRWFFVDLETGDAKPVPDHFSPEKVRRIMFWAQDQGAPLVIKPMRTRRLRQTTMVGDVIVYDRWSPYDTMTITPYFPYFRRGKTRGMVEDLMDPQDEVNKRRSARINIIGRSSNGGWIFEKNVLSNRERNNLKHNGSAPGLILEWDSQGGTYPEPKQIIPGVAPIAMTQLEQEAEDDLKEISGISEAALGQIDAANASGRAVEARQRQSVVGLEGFRHNWSRSKKMQGRKHLNLVQNHYTEERVVRVMGENKSNPQEVIINQRTATGIINNLSVGIYDVSIDESPLNASFLEGQFNEMLRLKELGFPVPDEWMIDASTMPRKDELKALMEQIRQQQVEGLPVPETEGRGADLGELAAVGVDQTGGPVV